MARLPKGTPPAPLAARLKRYHTDLVERGGRRLPSVDLEPEGAQALDALLQRDGLTIKQTVTNALISYARAVR